MTCAGRSARKIGESIREHAQSFSFRLALAAFVLVLVPVLAASCGGEDEESDTSEPAPETTVDPGSQEPAESTTVSLEDDEPEDPFTLAEDQPVPPDFRAAYERRSPLVVQFYKQGDFSFYPQGMQPDTDVSDAVTQLQEQYPEIEFFSYEINSPGEAETSAGLELDQYGTLAAQLGVGFTPYVALLAPQEDGYAYLEVFEGYVTGPVLEQALNELAQVQPPEQEGDAGQ